MDSIIEWYQWNQRGIKKANSTMSGKRIGRKRKVSPRIGGSAASIKVSDLGQWGNHRYGIRIVRLISNDSLNAYSAALAVKAATKFVEQFEAKLLVTPGGFGVAESQYPYGEKQATQAVEDFLREFLQLTPAQLSFDIVLGVDTEDGKLQDSYLIPQNTTSIEQCIRAWKSYPREDESRYVITKGRPCPYRVVQVSEARVSMLICHDMASFAKRSQVNRGMERERWAIRLDSEVTRGANTGVVHLIHYLDSSSQGRIFTSGMEAIIDSGVTWGISTFKTMLNPVSGLRELGELEERTARFAPLTLDLYVS